MTTWSKISLRTAATPIKPALALIQDLKQRGMLEDTLVIWGGEFGRTPMVQGVDGSRMAATIIPMRSPCGWPAAESSAGCRIGETDELGFNVAKDQVHVHDLHATILQLAGIRSHQADLQIPGTQLPADGCSRPRGG